ncbi:MAG: hypothetical protein WCT04_07220 [Planctomycetota bacterium]
MRLHWFREHKQIVYYVLCPLIVLSMSLFGIFGVSQFKGIGGTGGPSVTYAVGNKEGSLSAGEALNKRVVLFKFVGGYEAGDNRRENNPTTDNIGLLVAEIELARQRGFEIGETELKELLRNTVKERIESIDRSPQAKNEPVTRDLYEKLLQQMDMPASQFEQMIHDLSLRAKFHQVLSDSVEASEQQMFIKYSGEKENVRIRYKVFKSDDFVKDAKTPTDSEIKKFFDDHKKEASSYKDIYMTPATMSLEAVAFKDDKMFENLKASDADLKATYDNNKAVQWKDTKDPKKTDAFLPFESVKDKVEALWRTDKIATLKRTVQDNVKKAIIELTEAEAKAKKDAKDPKEIKPVDVAAWAAKNKFTYWETKEQTEELYEKGKFAINAPDLNLGVELFRNTKLAPSQPESLLETQKKRIYEFTYFKWLDESKPELGGIIARAKKFTDETDKTLEQAKDKIVAELKQVESLKLAEDAAKKQSDSWKQGQNLPKLEDLDEVVSEGKPFHPLVRTFRKSPKGLGDVLEVAEGQPELEKMDSKDYAKKWYYVGCAVERKVPSIANFGKISENEWSREEALHGKSQSFQGQSYRVKAGIIDDDYKSVLGLMVEQVKSKVTIIGKGPEPDVRTTFRDSQNHSSPDF